MGQDQAKPGDAAPGPHAGHGARQHGGGRLSGSDLDARINKSLISFKQLCADVRHLNRECSKYFVHPLTRETLYCQAFTKLKSDNLVPLFWKLKDNVIVAVQPQPPAGSAADAKSKPAEAKADAAEVDGPAKADDAAVGAAAAAAADTKSAAAPEAAAAAAAPAGAVDEKKAVVAAPKKAVAVARSLTIREFYALYIYMCDNVNVLQRAAQAANKDAGADADAEEDKLCAICMDSNIQVMLGCLHSFCEKCISDWNIKSKTCPVCRTNTDVRSDEYWSIVDDAGTGEDGDTAGAPTGPPPLPDTKTLHIMAQTPFDLIAQRPPFPMSISPATAPPLSAISAPPPPASSAAASLGFFSLPGAAPAASAAKPAAAAAAPAPTTAAAASASKAPAAGAGPAGPVTPKGAAVARAGAAAKPSPAAAATKGAAAKPVAPVAPAAALAVPAVSAAVPIAAAAESVPAPSRPMAASMIILSSGGAGSGMGGAPFMPHPFMPQSQMMPHDSMASSLGSSSRGYVPAPLNFGGAAGGGAGGGMSASSMALPAVVVVTPATAGPSSSAAAAGGAAAGAAKKKPPSPASKRISPKGKAAKANAAAAAATVARAGARPPQSAPSWVPGGLHGAAAEAELIDDVVAAELVPRTRWDCRACTYENGADDMKCAMCDARRP